MGRRNRLDAGGTAVGTRGGIPGRRGGSGGGCGGPRTLDRGDRSGSPGGGDPGTPAAEPHPLGDRPPGPRRRTDPLRTERRPPLRSRLQHEDPGDLGRPGAAGPGAPLRHPLPRGRSSPGRCGPGRPGPSGLRGSLPGSTLPPLRRGGPAGCGPEAGGGGGATGGGSPGGGRLRLGFHLGPHRVARGQPLPGTGGHGRGLRRGKRSDGHDRDRGLPAGRRSEDHLATAGDGRFRGEPGPNRERGGSLRPGGGLSA